MTVEILDTKQITKDEWQQLVNVDCKVLNITSTNKQFSQLTEIALCLLIEAKAKLTKINIDRLKTILEKTGINYVLAKEALIIGRSSEKPATYTPPKHKNFSAHWND